MTTTLALWAILMTTLVTTAASAPMMWEFRRELAAAKARTANYAATGCLLVLAGMVGVSLWWYVALSAHMILLGVIPSVGFAWSIVVRFITDMAKA